MTVTENELLDALRTARHAEADYGPTDAQTLLEIAHAMGVDERIARRRLHPLVMSAQVECVRVRRPAMDGRLANVPAYRVVAQTTPPKQARR